MLTSVTIRCCFIIVHNLKVLNINMVIIYIVILFIGDTHSRRYNIYLVEEYLFSCLKSVYKHVRAYV